MEVGKVYGCACLSSSVCLCEVWRVGACVGQQKIARKKAEIKTRKQNGANIQQHTERAVYRYIYREIYTDQDRHTKQNEQISNRTQSQN